VVELGDFHLSPDFFFLKNPISPPLLIDKSSDVHLLFSHSFLYVFGKSQLDNPFLLFSNGLASNL